MPQPIRFPELRDAEWLQSRYEQKGMTLQEIADEIGASSVGVLHALRRANIPTRSSASQRMRRGTAARPMYDSLSNGKWLRDQYVRAELSTEAIAQIIGCTHEAVRKALERHGVPIRTINRTFTKAKVPQLGNPEWLREQRVDLRRSTRDIADELGCSEEAVIKALWRHQIRIREPLPRGIDLATSAIRTRSTSSGYVHVWAPDHPAATAEKGYVPRHRLVAEAALGRFLTKSEVVHHLNIKPGDDRLENLIVFPSNAMHMSFHANPPPWIPRCECCGKPNPESLKGRPDSVPLLYKAS